MMTALLSNLVQIRTGYQFREKAPFSPDGRYSIIQLKDSNEALLLDEQEFQKFDLENIKDSDLVSKGDVLLRAKGNNHYAVHVDRQLKDCLASGLSLVLRCDQEKLLPAFLTWYLNQPPAQAFLNKIAAGTSIPIVSKRTLLDLVVPLPPLRTQETIGSLSQLLLKEESLRKEVVEAKRRSLNAKMLALVEENQSLNVMR